MSATSENFLTRPLFLLISGPAGSGKTTLCERMESTFPEKIRRVITCTTRPPRDNETNGIDYHFLSRENFEKKVALGEFLEHANVHQNLYGTRKKDVVDLLEKNINLIAALDVQGAHSVRTLAKSDTLLRRSLVSIFIMPRSDEELLSRLSGRGTDDAAEISRRLEIAKIEMKRWHEYDYLLESGTRADDFEKIKSIYFAEKMRIL